MKRYIGVVGKTAVAVALLYMCACAGEEVRTEDARRVRVAEVTALDRSAKTFSAVVAADQFGDLAFKHQGLVVRMYVEEGQHVREGSVVAEIDAADFQLAVDDKRAAFQKASAERDRADRLLGMNAVSQQEYESALAAYTNARVALENAQNALGQTRLRAPFDGFVQKKYVENYQRVQPGEPVVCLVNPDRLQVVTTVPETSVNHIISPAKVEVEFDAYKGVRFNARIKRYVEASADGAGIPVYVAIDDPRFDLARYRVSVGFSCKVHTVTTDTAMAGKMGVPLSAVVFDNAAGQESVFVYDPTTKRVSRRHITSNGTMAGRNTVVAEGGLHMGELVVTAGASLLNDGDSVVIKN